MLPRGWAALVLVAGAATSARAQVSDELGIERFRIAIDRAGLLDVEWAGVPGHLSWGAGVLVGFAHDPLVVYDRDMNPVEAIVESRLTTTLVGSLALFDRVQLGATIDIVGHQTGSQTPVTMIDDWAEGGAGDARLVAKVLVAGNARYQVSLVPALTVPLGEAGSYLREPGVGFAPAFAVSSRFSKARVAMNGGYHLKPRVETATLVSDDEVFVRLGAGVTLGPANAPYAELWWSASAASPLADAAKNQVAVETLLGGARQVTTAVSVFVAGGLGLDNGFGTPDWRALGGVRFEIASGDRDGDRVVGAADRCPDVAEDADGFEDGDGCPELDNDRDGVADGKDRCPEAEDKDGFQDDDGCADLDNDGDRVVDAQDRCPSQAEDVDGFQDDDGCVDGPARVTGIVVDPQGRPIRAARVTIVQLDAANTAPIELTAGDDGKFSAELHGGFLDVQAQAGEYQPGKAALSIAAGGTGEVKIELVRAVRQGQLRGQVLSFAGKPLAATIKVTGKSSATASTDAEGNFSIELPEGAFSVEISSPGHATQTRSVKIKLDGVTVLNVDLRGGK